MAVYLDSSGMLALSGPERRALELALDAAIACPGSRTTHATLGLWLALKKALA
jgi:hypothetical protein